MSWALALAARIRRRAISTAVPMKTTAPVIFVPDRAMGLRRGLIWDAVTAQCVPSCSADLNGDDLVGVEICCSYCKALQFPVPNDCAQRAVLELMCFRVIFNTPVSTGAVFRKVSECTVPSNLLQNKLVDRVPSVGRLRPIAGSNEEERFARGSHYSSLWRPRSIYRCK